LIEILRKENYLFALESHHLSLLSSIYNLIIAYLSCHLHLNH